jgi:3-phenylpropionate/cinnamic acid dioxygenase small subunit
MSALLTRAEAEDLLYREAFLLDTGDWDAWLALFTPDVVFWMPAWRDETTQTADPDAELSLIYYKGRKNLEDRVKRARSGLSIASTPLPRVVHAVTNVLVLSSDGGQAHVAASFTVHRYDARAERTDMFFGRYDYVLQPQADGWRIARKKITLLNDVIPTVLDVFSI